MITEVNVSILANDRMTFFHIATLKAKDGADIERRGHEIAAAALDALCGGLWCYRYGKLADGVTVTTKGAVASKYDAEMVDGVTNMSLIADGGFTGQFQWIRDGLGGYVPAMVDTVDPERDARHAAKQAEYEAEERRKSEAIERKLADLPQMDVPDDKRALWQSWVDANTDGYGGAVMQYAERWARLMQAEINPEVADIFTTPVSQDERTNAATIQGVMIAFAGVAERTSHEANAGIGITGFMYGAAVSMLSQAWRFGEHLRRWHNQQYGHDGAGVVNPAILTIGE